MPCPDANHLADLATGSLVPGEAQQVEAHVAGCEPCRTLLASLARSSLLPPAAPAELERGACLGRFTILSRAGAGGMGTVYAAYDPELDRRVALKVLHAQDGQERLVSEARAMARLAHPNVVPVLDLGTDHGRVYLAMEFVEGLTLTAWLAQGPRSRREVLATLLEAGRGLAAAHDAGLTHRDFKPENVLVGRDGRVRVTDFGLAREVPSPGVGGSLGQTRAGGTPAYMSPEQFQGRAVGPAADQFAFCVVLWEALFGCHPFVEDFAAAVPVLAGRVLRGEVLQPPADRDVPAWLRRILLRGLQVDPAQRFPAMRALLDALAADPSVTVRRRLVLAGAVGLVAVLGAGAVQQGRVQRGACSGARAELETVWNAERRSAVQAAFEGTRLPYAPQAFASFSGALDRWAGGWEAMHTRACEATRAHEQSAHALDLRMACLSRRLLELQATVDLAAQADAKVVEKAGALAEGLRPLDGCADLDLLGAPSQRPRDPGVRARLAALDRTLARAKSLEEAGRYDEGLALAAEGLRLAREVDHAPSLAEALVREGGLLRLAGRFPEAEARLEEAFGEAQRGRDDAVAARAAVGLVLTLGEDSARSAEGRRLGRLAGAVLTRAGGDLLLEAQLEDGLGGLGMNEGRFQDALEHSQRAVELATRAGGPEHLQAIVAGSHVANALAELGRYEESAATLRAILEVVERTLGPEHPRAGNCHHTLAGVLPRLGRLDEALAAAVRARDLWTRALGAGHPLATSAQFTLGNVLFARGRNEEALEAYRAAQRAWERAGNAEADVAGCRHNAALVLTELGRLEEALVEERHALAINLRVLGPEHPDVANSHEAISHVLRLQGQYPEALREGRRALESRLKVLGADHPYVALARLAVGQALLGLREHAEAATGLEQALAVLEAKAPAPADLAEARFALARALAGRGAPGDAARARNLAVRARAAAVEAERPTAEIDAWLALPRR